MHAALAAVALIPALALTQVPGKMSYQGRILQPDGNPEVGPVNVTFAIYSTDTNGTALWSEAQKLALTDGYYSTVLGGGDTPLPNNVFDGGLRYLSVTVNGTELLPRQLIASVPYAMSAGRLVGPSAALGGVLRANWQLNENTGLTAADSSGAGNTGTFTTGTFGWVASGHNGSAVSFVGSGEMIAAASPSLAIFNGQDL